MNLKKIKEILSSKKVQVVTGAVTGALVILLAGSIILHNKNIESRNVAVEKDNILEDKKEEDTNGKKNDKEQLEELKNIDTSNLTDDEKKELENKIADIENKISNEESSENKNNEVEKNSSNSTSSSSISESNSSTTISNSSTSNSSNSKPDTENSSNSSSVSNNTTQSSSGSTGGSISNKEETHNWVPITSVIHHDEEGNWEDVVVTPAWTEEVPVYENQARVICNDCGEDLTDLTESALTQHLVNHGLNGGHGSYKVEYRQIQVGTNTVNHDAVIEKKWVVDKAAWDETVVTGYRCTIHGETK